VTFAGNAKRRKESHGAARKEGSWEAEGERERERERDVRGKTAAKTGGRCVEPK